MRLPMLWRGIGLVVLTGVSLTLGRYHSTASTMTATRTPSTAPKEMPFMELCSPLYQTPTYSGQSSCVNNINGTGKAMTWPDIINSTIKVTINGKASHDVRIAVWTYWDDSTTVTPRYKEVRAVSKVILPLSSVMPLTALTGAQDVAITTSVDGWPAQTVSVGIKQ
jgi:hypothetical protein